MSHEYDTAFRTMEVDCPRLLIPVVNEIFHQNYALDEKVVILPNEQMITTPEDEQTIRITDSNFMIIGSEKTRYHIECESNPNGRELQVRFFEYDTQIALDNREYDNGIMRIKLPKSAVLYLRHGKRTPDFLQTIIEDDGQEIRRKIPVIKVQNYSLEEIFEKKLWFFLPFHIFVHEKMLSVYNEDDGKRKLLMDEYREILDYLNRLYHDGDISALEKYSIITSIRDVVGLIAKGKNNVIKEAEEIMGGKVLEYEAKTIYKNGINEGRQEGRLETVNAIDTMLADMVKSGILTEADAKARGDIAKAGLRKL